MTRRVTIDEALEMARGLYEKHGRFTKEMIAEAAGVSKDYFYNRGLRMREVYEYIGAPVPKNSLIPREEIISMSINGKTQEEIARRLGIKKSQVYHVIYHAREKGVNEWIDDTKEQPCWSCANAINGCVWSRSKATQPVPGWDAEQVYIKTPEQKLVSYKIEHCPEYKHDGRSRVNLERKMREYYGKSGSTD